MKIVISGFFGAGNTGDEVILEATIANLRNHLSDPDITVFSLSPKKTAADHQVKSIYRGWRHDFKEKVKALKEADLLISGGGGLLQDTYPTRFLFGPLPYYLLIVFLAKLCRTKVMFFSQGIGPVNSTWGKILMKIFANMADFITVRDQYSKDLLEQLGVTRPKTVVTSDIVFAYQPKADSACMESLKLEKNDNLVAVSVRPWFEKTKQFEQVAEILDRLIEERDVIPVFVPMEGHHDVLASQKVLVQMKHRDKCYILAEHFSPNQYVNFISQCKLLIGMRLHALIFSTITGVPHIGLSYDKKVESMLKRNGMWEFSSRLEEIDSEKLTENALYLLQNQHHYSQSIKNNANDLKQEALRNVELLKEKFVH